MHANCIGLKAVLADGTIIDQMNPHERTDAGYDLKQLFVGSEGTLVSISTIFINNMFTGNHYGMSNLLPTNANKSASMPACIRRL